MRIGLVLGCIDADLCKYLFLVLTSEHFSRSARYVRGAADPLPSDVRGPPELRPRWRILVSESGGLWSGKEPIPNLCPQALIFCQVWQMSLSFLGVERLPRGIPYPFFDRIPYFEPTRYSTRRCSSRSFTHARTRARGWSTHLLHGCSVLMPRSSATLRT